MLANMQITIKVCWVGIWWNYLHDRTNNAEQFCGQRKGGKFKCEHL